MNLGIGELLLLCFILVVVFSAAQMGQLGNALGKFVYSFKKASGGQGFVDANRSPALKGRAASSPPEDAQLVDDDARHS